MSKYSINLVQTPNQTFSCNLEDDLGNLYAVDIDLRVISDGSLVANITVDDEPQRYGVICHNLMPLLPNNKINGNIYFEDLYGNDDPNFEQFNDRFILVYNTEFDLG